MADTVKSRERPRAGRDAVVKRAIDRLERERESVPLRRHGNRAAVARSGNDERGLEAPDHPPAGHARPRESAAGGRPGPGCRRAARRFESTAETTPATPSPRHSEEGRRRPRHRRQRHHSGHRPQRGTPHHRCRHDRRRGHAAQLAEGAGNQEGGKRRRVAGRRRQRDRGDDGIVERTGRRVERGAFLDEAGDASVVGPPLPPPHNPPGEHSGAGERQAGKEDQGAAPRVGDAEDDVRDGHRQRAGERAEADHPQQDAREPPAPDAGDEPRELVVCIRHHVTFRPGRSRRPPGS